MLRSRVTLALTPVVLLLAACGSAVASPTSSGSTAAPVMAAAVPAQASTASAPAVRPAAAPPVTPPVKPATLVPPHGLVWKRAPGSPAIQLALVSGGSATLMWMDPTRVRFRFIPGYAYPENSPSASIDNKPSTWTKTLLAAFNGGFHLSDGAGGYYYRGHTVKTLRTGLASMVLYTDGSMRVGVWGRTGFTRVTSSMVAVRQNLQPLIVGGVSVAKPGDWNSRWGSADGGAPKAKRTALGMRADGSLVFEFGDSTTGYGMASNLLKAGVKVAIMLDMNKSWPTGFVYYHVGSTLKGKRINSNILRDPVDTYGTRFKKDFVVVNPR